MDIKIRRKAAKGRLRKIRPKRRTSWSKKGDEVRKKLILERLVTLTRLKRAPRNVLGKKNLEIKGSRG